VNVENRAHIRRCDFAVRYELDSSWIRLELATFQQPLLMEIAVDSVTDFDRRTSVAFVDRLVMVDRERLIWAAESTLWTKRYHLDVFDRHIEFSAEVTGNGDVDLIRFFNLIADQTFRAQFVRLKHFADNGHTSAQSYAQGSPVAFTRVICPEPNAHGRQELAPYEYAQISVNGDVDHFGGNFVADPGLLCFAVAALPEQEWLAFGLAADAGDYLFSDYEYLGGTDFALAVTSWGARRVAGGFRTPRIIMVVDRDPERVFGRYVDVLRSSGLVPAVRREQPSWWSRPLVCGWGHQCHQADLFRVRSPAERQPDNAAYTLSTQATYREFVGYLNEQQLPWGTLVIDARWFLASGLKNVDTGRWPSLRAFIDQEHARGRRVLLWWGPWDTEGIPADECVRYRPDLAAGRTNRPGRLVKLGNPGPGAKLAVDISLPSVQERIRRQVRALLGSGGLDADGLKVDHVSTAPGIYGMAFPAGSQRLFGIEAVRCYLSLLYNTAKEVKPDALLVGQSPNPYLADVQDMVRVSPWSSYSESVAAEATFAARMCRVADPDWLIDTNAWPMPSLSAFREYTRLQPALGVPSLFYATHLDTTGDVLTGEDYRIIRDSWAAR
jgi:hypothetical protein